MIKKNIETIEKPAKLVKKLVGIVTSDKMVKSVVVQITEKKIHPMYGKVYLKNRKLMAHDEENTYKTGDKVEICETRPYSKNKSWKVVKMAGNVHDRSAK